MTTPRARTEAIERACLCAEPTFDTDTLGPDAARFDVYRRMVRGRFRDVLVASTPRFCAAVGDVAVDAWLTRWLDADGPRTRLFWQLPLTAEPFAEALSESGLVSPNQHALLRYELAIWRVRHAPFSRDAEVAALDFARVPVLTHARARLDLDFAPSEQTSAAQHTRFVIARRADDTVRVRTLNRVGALIFDAFAVASDRSITERVQDVIATHALHATPAFATSLGEMLAAWMEDGILLGSPIR